MSDGFTSEKIATAVEKNMPTILKNTRERVLRGETSIEEYEQFVDIV